jgi:hypothetical protein
MKIQINMSSKMIAKGTKQHNRNTSSIKQDECKIKESQAVMAAPVIR